MATLFLFVDYHSTQVRTPCYCRTLHVFKIRFVVLLPYKLQTVVNFASCGPRGLVSATLKVIYSFFSEFKGENIAAIYVVQPFVWLPN